MGGKLGRGPSQCVGGLVRDPENTMATMASAIVQTSFFNSKHVPTTGVIGGDSN